MFFFVTSLFNFLRNDGQGSNCRADQEVIIEVLHLLEKLRTGGGENDMDLEGQERFTLML